MRADSPFDRSVRSRLGALIALNAILLVALGAVAFGSRASAQNRPRGNYTMAGARIEGAPGSAVFVVDTVNREMIALTYDPNTKEIFGIGYRNIAADESGLSQGVPSR